MPLDGSGFHDGQSSRGDRFVTVCRRTANALALMWVQGPVARHVEQRSLRKSMEAAAVPELLCAARSLILSEEKWVQGRLRTGNDKFCAMGAILQASALGPGRQVRGPAIAHLQAVAMQRGFPTVEKMNDSSSHAEVLTAFDEAIRLSEARCNRAG